jgi:hypothetical protein
MAAVDRFEQLVAASGMPAQEKEAMLAKMRQF